MTTDVTSCACLGTVVRPGDHIIFTVPMGTYREQITAVAEGFAARLPDVKVVVVTASGMAVYRPGGDVEDV